MVLHQFNLQTVVLRHSISFPEEYRLLHHHHNNSNSNSRHRLRNLIHNNNSSSSNRNRNRNNKTSKSVESLRPAKCLPNRSSTVRSSTSRTPHPQFHGRRPRAPKARYGQIAYTHLTQVTPRNLQLVGTRVPSTTVTAMPARACMTHTLLHKPRRLVRTTCSNNSNNRRHLKMTATDCRVDSVRNRLNHRLRCTANRLLAMVEM